jgi:transposase-like protein
MGKKASAEETIRTIRRKTRRRYNAEEKMRIVLDGLGGEETVAELCRREGIAQSRIRCNCQREIKHEDVAEFSKSGFCIQEQP